MNAEQFFNNGFGADVEKVHRKHVIDLMTNFAKHYHTGGCMTAEKAFWEYWDKRFQFTSRNEKVLSLSANFRNTKEAFLAGWEAKNTKTPNNEFKLIHTKRSRTWLIGALQVQHQKSKR